MNPIWLLRNCRNAWRHSLDLPGFLLQLLWGYSAKLPKWFFARQNTILFQYPPPIGIVTLTVRSNGSDGFIFGEVFNHRYYDLGLTIAPETILDLGANAGFTAVYFGKIYPKAEISCVEPMSDNVRVLRMNLALNEVNATVIPAAIAVMDGSILMQVAEKDYAHKVAGMDLMEDSKSKTVTVPALTIPTILKKLNWQRVGLLKVDIEGYEKVLFAGNCSWLDLVDAMCIECHDGFGENDLIRLAKDHNFSSPQRLPGIWLLERNGQS